MNSKETRNYVIDILRILSIAFVVTLHVLGHGGVLKNATGISFAASYGLEAVAYCAVDCFVIITGYCMCLKSFKSKRLLSLWAECFFYSVCIAVVFALIEPQSNSGEMLLRAFSPVSTNQWWFYTQYFALSFAMPLLNVALSKMDEKGVLRIFFAVFFILFSIIPFAQHVDLFKTAKGYSVFWFMLLYLLGGCLRLTKTRFKYQKTAGMAIYAISVLLTWVPFVAISFGKVPFFEPWKDQLYSYTSPFVVLAAVGLLILFKSIVIKNSVIQRCIAIVTPTVFAVYLISDHRLVRNLLITDKFIPFASLSPIELICLVSASVAVIFVLCFAIERIRILLFKTVRIDHLLSSAGDAIDMRIAKCSNRGEQ